MKNAYSPSMEARVPVPGPRKEPGLKSQAWAHSSQGLMIFSKQILPMSYCAFFFKQLEILIWMPVLACRHTYPECCILILNPVSLLSSQIGYEIFLGFLKALTSAVILNKNIYFSSSHPRSFSKFFPFFYHSD